MGVARLRWRSLGVVGAIRSFDPCLPCPTHVHSGDGRVVTGQVNTCACGVE